MARKRAPEWLIRHPAYRYAVENVRKPTTPKYVKLQMQDFLKVCRGENAKYRVSRKKLDQLDGVLSLLLMPRGMKAGQSLKECSTGYQWLFYVAVLAMVYVDEPTRRRYELGLLEICRKNFKTYTIATIFLYLILTEPRFSRFFSVAPDGALSREIKHAISETIQASPGVYEWQGKKRFKILRDSIKYFELNSSYEPLAYSTSRMDGRMPTAWIADEVGALPSNYPIEAMKSGQLNVPNRLGFIVSTKYPTFDNPFEDEIKYAKRVLDGQVEDDTIFSLLYEPDDPTYWLTRKLPVMQSNPAALENPVILEDLLKKQAYAQQVEAARENFATKHCNVLHRGAASEAYIDIADVIACRSDEPIDWSGRVVYLGLDLSQTSDNTSVAMLAIDDDNRLLVKTWAFVPAGRIEDKTASERIDYHQLAVERKVIPCGDRVIDYGVVESFILAIPAKYKVEVQSVGYDRWNAMSTAQRLDRAGMQPIEVPQTAAVMHPPAKLLKEKILTGDFVYDADRLLEANFQRTRCAYDHNRNLFVHKKRSEGSIDSVTALLNAVCLAQKDMMLDAGDFVVQTTSRKKTKK